MTALAKREEGQQVTAQAETPVSDTVALYDMIERVMRDPAADVGKARELMAMRKEIAAEQASQAWDEAMTLVQEEMRPIAADASNPQTRSRYASYLALDKAMRPIYTKHGFSLGFNTEESTTPDTVMVVCDVSRGGHTRRYRVPMPADGKGAKGGDVMTKTHAVGSAMTYGQRYLIKFIFNIAVGTDDDGNAAGAGEPITPEQLAELIQLADEVGADKAKFCEIMKVESFAAIPKARFAEAAGKLHNKRAFEARKAKAQP